MIQMKHTEGYFDMKSELVEFEGDAYFRPYPPELGEEKRPFLTGSVVYGYPNKDSDLDLVVRCDATVAQYLRSISALSGTHSEAKESDYGTDSTNLHFGKLNIILCETDREYDIWAEGTRMLIDQAPVDRDHSVRLFRELRHGS